MDKCGLLNNETGGTSGKEPTANARDLRDTGSIPGSGRSSREGDGNPLQYFCLKNPMDRGAWQATVHGIARVGHDLSTKPPPPFFPKDRYSGMYFISDKIQEVILFTKRNRA